MRRLRVAALAAALLQPCALATAAEPAPADIDLADEADLHFRLGVEAYRVENYEQALEHLLMSNRLVRNRNVVFNIARAYEQLGRYAEAFRSYSEYLELETAPDRREGALRAIERIRPQVALVRIASEPPGATIYVDRKDLGPRGVTPKVLALEPGQHRVLVELAGHEPAESAPFAVELGRSTDVELPLKRILGRAQVTGTPEGAEVRVGDGEGPVVGRLPAAIDLVPGTHVLFISARGHQPVRQTVTVQPREETRVQIDLPLETGTLVVDAEERDALIEIDGKPAGFTPAVLSDVPAGFHKVRVSLSGFRPHLQDVVVEPRESVQVRAQLRPLQEVTAASRTTESIEDAPASVSLISREEIRAFGDQTLYEALAGTRGVFQTDDRTYKSVGFRGFSRPGEDYGNRVLVTLDGHTMNDDQLGSSYVGYDFRESLEDVQRIEVVRGPGSVLYGTNAFFGVINVVTRDGRDVPRPHVSVAADGERTVRARGGAGYGDEHAGAWIGVGGVKSQGGDLSLPGVAPDEVLRGADEAEAGWAGGKAWWGDLTLQVDVNHRNKRIPTGAFETIPGDDRARSEDTRGFAELRFEPSLGEDDRLYLRAYVDWYRFRGGYPYDDPETGVVRDAWDGLWAGGEGRVVYGFGEWLRLTIGGEGRAELQADLTSRDVSGTYLDEDARYQVYSGYGTVDLRPAEWIALSFGTRVDHFSTFGSAVSPRAAVIVRPWTDGVLKLMGGRAFRAPSPYELSYNDDGVTQIAAEDLDAETIYTTEAEYTHRLARSVTATASAFYNTINDLVVVGETTTGTGDEAATVGQYRNLDDEVNTVGGEVEVRREWRERWMLSASYSFQRTRVGGLGDGEEISNSPAHLFALKGVVPVTRGGPLLANRLRVEAPRLTRDGEDTETALLWDVTLTGQLPQWHLEYGVGLRNVLDWRVDHPTGGDIASPTVPQPGRTLFATATLAY